MKKFEVGQVYRLPNYNNKGQNVRIEDIEGGEIYYTYLESGQQGHAQMDKEWAQSMELVMSSSNDDLNQDDFYICWVPNTTHPPKVKHPTLKMAKAAATHLVNTKGVKKVYILKTEMVAVKPEPTAEFNEIKR